LDTCVLLNSGSAYNIVPDTATLAGTIRYFKDEVCTLAEGRMRELCRGFAVAYGVEIHIDLRNIFDVLVNDASLSDAYMEAAADIVGKDNITNTDEPATGSEDFADMLKVIPGAYCRVGHSGTTGLHNPSFFLDPEILPVGASIMTRIAERRLTS
jgi:metal-dependent amidase/aminoacylase/carboxypeptidase family protein